ncbi:AraC family transcriptional regulator [Microcoleus sp. S13_C5]|uniref:AraC family transcriptional regulator n=1 Tax=Microcoleus sp. S13_C5 TaxID=3055411 RepID=UPI002FD1C3E8
MPEVQPISVDVTQQDLLLQTQIFPRPSLLSSETLGWESIHVQHHRQPSWEVPKHYNQQHVICIKHIQNAYRTEHTLDGRRESHRVGDGSILLIPAQIEHGGNWDKEINFTLLMLEPTHIVQIAHEFVDTDRVNLVPLFNEPDALIHQIGLALLSELKSEGVGTRLYADSMATALWVHLLKKYSTQPLRESTHSVGNNQLRPAIEFINENLDKDLKLAEIAAVVNMSQFYFARMFKQFMGISPHQYVVQRRIERSQQLLAKTQLSVAQIACQVGFSNQSHFTAQFRKATGITPKGYRNSL